MATKSDLERASDLRVRQMITFWRKVRLGTSLLVLPPTLLAILASLLLCHTWPGRVGCSISWFLLGGTIALVSLFPMTDEMNIWEDENYKRAMKTVNKEIGQ